MPFAGLTREFSKYNNNALVKQNQAVYLSSSTRALLYLALPLQKNDMGHKTTNNVKAAYPVTFF